MNENQLKAYKKYRDKNIEMKVRIPKDLQDILKNRMLELNYNSYQSYIKFLILSDLEK